MRMPRQHHLPSPDLCTLISSLSRVKHIHISLRFTHTHTYHTAARRASRLCRSQSSMKTSRSSCHRYAPQTTAAATCLQRAPLARLLQRVISSYWSDLTKGSGMGQSARHFTILYRAHHHIYESYFRISPLPPRVPIEASRTARCVPRITIHYFSFFPARGPPSCGRERERERPRHKVSFGDGQAGGWGISGRDD